MRAVVVPQTTFVWCVLSIAQRVVQWTLPLINTTFRLKLSGIPSGASLAGCAPTSRLGKSALKKVGGLLLSPEAVLLGGAWTPAGKQFGFWLLAWPNAFLEWTTGERPVKTVIQHPQKMRSMTLLAKASNPLQSTAFNQNTSRFYSAPKNGVCQCQKILIIDFWAVLYSMLFGMM